MLLLEGEQGFYVRIIVSLSQETDIDKDLANVMKPP
jgi:hypothetical protein